MDQTVAQGLSEPLATDTQALRRAVELLSKHMFLKPLLIAAMDDGYKFSINADLKCNAVHNPRSYQNSNPTIEFRPSRTDAQYAESLCHELIHFAITLAGRFYTLGLNPIADMAKRQCEEACVLAITSDLMHQAAHGIHMQNNASHPELWAANLDSSFYTARAYEQQKHDHLRAVQASFECFYTMPAQIYRNGYQIYSMNTIIKESKDTLLNPKNFIEKFNPVDFGKFLPTPYNDILKPCLARMDPLDREHLVLYFYTAKEAETLFNRRRSAFGTPPPNLKIAVAGTDGEIFSWHLGGESLEMQRSQSQKQTRLAPAFHPSGTLAFA